MINVVVLSGRLGKTPELMHVGDIPKVSFALAVQRAYVAKGQDRITDWIDCVAWRKNAEFLAKHFKMGDYVEVVGQLQTRNWEDKAGNKRKSVDVVVTEIRFGNNKTEVPSNKEFAPIEYADDEDIPF